MFKFPTSDKTLQFLFATVKEYSPEDKKLTIISLSNKIYSVQCSPVIGNHMEIGGNIMLYLEKGKMLTPGEVRGFSPTNLSQKQYLDMYKIISVRMGDLS
jgi:hypothetical protein